MAADLAPDQHDARPRGRRRAIVFVPGDVLRHLVGLPDTLDVVSVRDDWLRNGVSLAVEGDGLEVVHPQCEPPNLSGTWEVDGTGRPRFVLDGSPPALDKPAREPAAPAAVYEEWRVTGDPGDGFSPYAHTWSQFLNPELGEDAEVRARGFESLVRMSHQPQWRDGPHLSRRTVTVSEWERIDGQ